MNGRNGLQRSSVFVCSGVLIKQTHHEKIREIPIAFLSSLQTDTCWIYGFFRITYLSAFLEIKVDFIVASLEGIM